MTDAHDVIAAFIDGERVDTEALKHALADAAGRDYLVDALALRELIAEPEVTGRIEHHDTRALPKRWLLAAAAMIAVGVLSGYAVGRLRPLSPAVEAGFHQPITAPAPTHVIRLEPGVNWQEQKGGN
jgi:hypothetical protein